MLVDTALHTLLVLLDFSPPVARSTQSPPVGKGKGELMATYDAPEEKAVVSGKEKAAEEAARRQAIPNQVCKRPTLYAGGDKKRGRCTDGRRA